MNPLKNLLGIVIYEQTIAVAEVESVDGSFAVRKCAEYTLPQGITIENLSSESAGFKLFLKEHAFKSKKAVVGLSAKQMISTWLKLHVLKIPRYFTKQYRFTSDGKQKSILLRSFLIMTIN